MGDSRTKNVSRNILSGIVNKTVGMILPFVSRTVILYMLGSVYLGIGTLFTSVLSFLSLAELGIGSAITFAMYQPIHEGQTEKISALLKYYKTLYRIIGVAVLIIGTVIVPFVPYLIKGKLPTGLNIYVLYYIYLINSVISYFIAGYRQSLLSAYQRSDVISNITMIVNVFNHMCQIVIIVLTNNYYMYAIVPIAGTIINNITIAILTRKMYPTIKCKGVLSEDERQQINKKMGGLFGTKLNSIVVHQADILVISAFIGITTVAEYGNYYYIMNAVCGFISIIFSSMTASVGNKIVVDSKENCYKLFRKINFINTWIVGWCAVCFICLFQPFMNIWVGEDLMLDMPFVILFTIYFFIYEIQRPILTFKDAAGLWYEDRVRPYVSMILNIILNLLLVHIIGLYGIVISTIISFSISLPWVNYILFKKLFNMQAIKNILDIAKNAFVIIFAAISTYLLCSVCGDGFIWLLVRCTICMTIPNFIFYVFFRKLSEFKDMLNIAKKVLQRGT